jgi:hypothetical protein
MLHRRQDVELLRILSAFGIVWFHTYAPFSEVAYAGLIVFLLISSRFAADPDRHPTTVKSKAKRILLPWLVWFGIYGALNVARGLPFIPGDGLVSGILTGTSIHLWYMPFMFGVLCILDWTKVKLDVRASARLYATLGLMVLGTAFLWRTPSLRFPLPLPQYFHAGAAVLLGAVFANRHGLPRNIFALVVLAFTGLSAALMPWEGLGLTYLIGIVIAAAVLLSKRDVLGHLNVSRISGCMQGVYLSHFLWWMVVSKIGSPPGILLPLTVFGASTLSVMIAKRFAPKLSGLVV